jgi:hypothetical protein
LLDAVEKLHKNEGKNIPEIISSAYGQEVAIASPESEESDSGNRKNEDGKVSWFDVATEVREVPPLTVTEVTEKTTGVDDSINAIPSRVGDGTSPVLSSDQERDQVFSGYASENHAVSKPLPVEDTESNRNTSLTAVQRLEDTFAQSGDFLNSQLSLDEQEHLLMSAIEAFAGKQQLVKQSSQPPLASESSKWRNTRQALGLTGNLPNKGSNSSLSSLDLLPIRSDGTLPPRNPIRLDREPIMELLRTSEAAHGQLDSESSSSSLASMSGSQEKSEKRERELSLNRVRTQVSMGLDAGREAMVGIVNQCMKQVAVEDMHRFGCGIADDVPHISALDWSFVESMMSRFGVQMLQRVWEAHVAGVFKGKNSNEVELRKLKRRREKRLQLIRDLEKKASSTDFGGDLDERETAELQKAVFAIDGNLDLANVVEDFLFMLFEREKEYENRMTKHQVAFDLMKQRLSREKEVFSTLKGNMYKEICTLKVELKNAQSAAKEAQSSALLARAQRGAASPMNSMSVVLEELITPVEYEQTKADHLQHIAELEKAMREQEIERDLVIQEQLKLHKEELKQSEEKMASLKAPTDLAAQKKLRDDLQKVRQDLKASQKSLEDCHAECQKCNLENASLRKKVDTFTVELDRRRVVEDQLKDELEDVRRRLARALDDVSKTRKELLTLERQKGNIANSISVVMETATQTEDDDSSSEAVSVVSVGDLEDDSAYFRQSKALLEMIPSLDEDAHEQRKILQSMKVFDRLQQRAVQLEERRSSRKEIIASDRSVVLEKVLTLDMEEGKMSGKQGFSGHKLQSTQDFSRYSELDTRRISSTTTDSSLYNKLAAQLEVSLLEKKTEILFAPGGKFMAPRTARSASQPHRPSPRVLLTPRARKSLYQAPSVPQPAMREELKKSMKSVLPRL